LQVAAITFESHEGMLVTDAETDHPARQSQLLVKSPATTPSEAVGQTPRLLKSGRHDTGFYQPMWGRIVAHGHLERRDLEPAQERRAVSGLGHHHRVCGAGRQGHPLCRHLRRHHPAPCGRRTKSATWRSTMR
jgi:hypothetical protein